MNRFQTQRKNILSKIWGIFSGTILISFILFFLFGLQSVNRSTTSEQLASLERTILKDVIHCYATEGTYPPNLDYLKEHYGLSYNEELFFVDYISIGSNIMPDVTVIPLYQNK